MSEATRKKVATEFLSGIAAREVVVLKTNLKTLAEQQKKVNNDITSLKQQIARAEKRIKKK